MPSVKQCWINKYGQQIGLKMWQQQKKKYGKTKSQLQEKYGKQYVDKLSQKKSTFCQKHYIKKYGKKIGKSKWQQVKKKKVDSCNAKLQNGSFNIKNCATYTLRYYQEKYGLQQGIKRWNARFNQQRYLCSIQRYIDQYGQQLGRSICKKIKDNTSKQAFIQRYGQQQGILKYKQYCNNMSDITNKRFLDPKERYKCALTLNNMINKYGQVQGVQRYNSYKIKLLKHLSTISRHSKGSQQLFWSIYHILSEQKKSLCKFYPLTKQQLFYVGEADINHIFVDFKCGSHIIQYDGQYWHKNSKQKDIMRDNWLSKHGYYVLRIGDIQYYDNKEETIIKCLRFLNDET